ncbi:MAG: DinB family protein [Bacteroidia bacterium]|nr:DinB family protein [Bacteroidia bacterium]
MPQNDVLQSTEAARRLFETISEDESRTKPDENSWSALECLEHIVAVENAVLDILDKNLDVSSSDSVGVSKIQAVMSNRKKRFSAPENLLPEGRLATWQEATQKFFDQRRRLVETIANRVHEQPGTFDHPALGPMTKLDWIYFAIAHTERHLFQIKDVLAFNRTQ